MLIVQTTRRQGVSYLETTLAGLEKMTELRKCVVLSDGPIEPGIDLHGFELVELPKQGARATGWEAFKLAQRWNVDDVIVVQDDLALCADAAEVIHAAAVPAGCIALMFYTAYPPAGFQYSQPGEPRIVVGPANRASGAQALKYPRTSIDYFCSKDPFVDAAVLGVNSTSRHLLDDAIFQLASISSMPDIGLVLPCPIEHVGLVSSVDPHLRHLPVWSVGAGKKFPTNVRELSIIRV